MPSTTRKQPPNKLIHKVFRSITNGAPIASESFHQVPKILVFIDIFYKRQSKKSHPPAELFIPVTAQLPSCKQTRSCIRFLLIAGEIIDNNRPTFYLVDDIGSAHPCLQLVSQPRSADQLEIAANLLCACSSGG